MTNILKYLMLLASFGLLASNYDEKESKRPELRERKEVEVEGHKFTVAPDGKYSVSSNDESQVIKASYDLEEETVLDGYLSRDVQSIVAAYLNKCRFGLTVAPNLAASFLSSNKKYLVSFNFAENSREIEAFEQAYLMIENLATGESVKNYVFRDFAKYIVNDLKKLKIPSMKESPMQFFKVIMKKAMAIANIGVRWLCLIPSMNDFHKVIFNKGILTSFLPMIKGCGEQIIKYGDLLEHEASLSEKNWEIFASRVKERNGVGLLLDSWLHSGKNKTSLDDLLNYIDENLSNNGEVCPNNILIGEQYAFVDIKEYSLNEANSIIDSFNRGISSGRYNANELELAQNNINKLQAHINKQNIGNKNYFEILDLKNNLKVIWKHSEEGDIKSAFSKNGKIVAWYNGTTNTLNICDVKTNETKKLIFNDKIKKIELSNDGKMLYALFENRKVKSFDTKTGEVVDSGDDTNCKDIIVPEDGLYLNLLTENLLLGNSNIVRFDTDMQALNPVCLPKSNNSISDKTFDSMLKKQKNPGAAFNQFASWCFAFVFFVWGLTQIIE